MNPFNFNLGTSVNGNPNYNIGMNVGSGLFDAANQIYGSVGGGNQGGGVGGFSFNTYNGEGGVNNPGRSNAATQQVQRDQLMSERLNQLTSQDSPYMQRARREGEAIASRRGLMNSAIMGNASMGAAIDRAAPIAQFDAGRFGSVADQNMQAENQHRLQGAQLAAQLSAAAASASGQRYAADRARQSALDQMYMGHQFGAMDDYRRHMLGLETREDTQAFGAGQSDIDRGIQQDQFWNHQSPLAWAGMDLQNRQFGLEGRRFEHLAGMDMRNFNQGQINSANNMWLAQQQLLTQPALGIYSNPNLTGEQQNAAVNNWMNIAPGFGQQALQSMPPWMQGWQPSFANQSAWQGAAQLPPMRRRG